MYDVALRVLGPGLALGDPSVTEVAAWQEEYLFSRAVSIYGGTRQMQLTTIARFLLGLPSAPRARPRSDMLDAAAKVLAHTGRQCGRSTRSRMDAGAGGARPGVARVVRRIVPGPRVDPGGDPCARECHRRVIFMLGRALESDDGDPFGTVATARAVRSGDEVSVVLVGAASAPRGWSISPTALSSSTRATWSPRLAQRSMLRSSRTRARPHLLRPVDGTSIARRRDDRARCVPRDPRCL